MTCHFIDKSQNNGGKPQPMITNEGNPQLPTTPSPSLSMLWHIAKTMKVGKLFTSVTYQLGKKGLTKEIPWEGSSLSFPLVAHLHLYLPVDFKHLCLLHTLLLLLKNLSLPLKMPDC